MMFKRLLLILLPFFLMSTYHVLSQDDPKADKTQTSEKEKKKGPKTFADFITEKAISQDGLFSVHEVEEKMFFEIPLQQLGRDMLLVSRIAKLPANMSPYVNAGSKSGEQVVRWEKKGSQVFLRSISYSNIANEESAIHLSVQQNNFEPIMHAFKVLAMSDDSSSVLIQVNELFEKDVKFLSGLSQRNRTKFKVSRLDEKRSFIDTIRSFPQNIEVKHTMTYAASSPPSNRRAGSISMQMNQSMILLPAEPMKRRRYDERVGWFTVKQIDYSSEALKSDESQYIRRWRLEPKDPEAYLKGEIVEPIKPIIYYLDPATPKKWRKYFIQGIEDWQAVFEKAGFKNAIIAKVAPSIEEDPDFSPEDVRYSTIRYVASTTRNAMGPSVSDPRTGEILESDVIWYHNHLRSYRNRYLLETGAANPGARSLDTPEQDIGEMMRMVIAHEVGHALGFPHNMKASAAYPTDSLRSPAFTNKLGIAASIMDYARYNYVAQPGDGDNRFVRQLGPYDEYAVNWGYRWYGNNISADEETKILQALIVEKGDNPIYQFGAGYENDPNSQTECIGNDAVKASIYGINNLKVVEQNLANWICKEGENYDELREIHSELLGVWRRYLGHVSSNIGGMHKDAKRYGQEGVVYYPVEKSYQKKVMDFLEDEAFSTPSWLVDKNLIQIIQSDGMLKKINNIQIGQLHRLLNGERLGRMFEQAQLFGTSAYAPSEMLTDLNRIIWRELNADQEVDFFRRGLQTAYIHRLLSFIDEEANNNEASNDVQSLARFELKRLLENLKKKSKKKDGMDKIHFEHCATLILQNISFSN